MKLFRYLLILYFICFNSHADVLMLIRDDVFKNYQQFLNGRDVMKVNDFSGPYVRRDVVDMIIVQQALRLGGFQHRFKYGQGKVNYRNKQMLIKGKLLLSFDSYWLLDANDISEYVYISEPVINNGEYFAGIFANPNHPTIFTLASKEQLKNYTAVSTDKWKTDWKTLSELPLKKLVKEDGWVSQARMVEKMWVDFFLMPFQKNENSIYQLQDIKLKPVNNVAILLKDSRHFVVSKNHPLGNLAINAINKGMSKLRVEHKIYKAYKQAGFFIDEKQYNVINRN